MSMETVLPVIWFGVIGFGVLMYVLLDGFVLGLGILAPFAEDEHQLDHMMNTAAPIWDGNETWLVLGGAGLLAAFPKAYAVVLSALYLPVLLMLIALVFRGVAFEFRFKARAREAGVGRGVRAGLDVRRVRAGRDPRRAGRGHAAATAASTCGGAFGWFSPFSMLTGVAVVFGYALLGSTWLILKTEGRMQLIARTLTRPLVLVVVAFMGLVSAWLPFLDSRIMARWFEGGNFWWLAPVPLLALANAFALWRAAMREGRDAAPFVLTLCFFVLGFAGLVLGIWPNIVPPSLTIWQAASPPSSQGFVLAGLVVLLPAILGYTYWSYTRVQGQGRRGRGLPLIAAAGRGRPGGRHRQPERRGLNAKFAGARTGRYAVRPRLAAQKSAAAQPDPCKPSSTRVSARTTPMSSSPRATISRGCPSRSARSWARCSSCSSWR